MILLGTPKISGCVAVTSSEKGTVVCRIPVTAASPASLCVRNIDAAAIVYLKTVPREQGGKVSSTDCGVLLNSGEAYDWVGAPPRGCDVIAISSVNNSLLAVDGNWCVTEDDV